MNSIGGLFLNGLCWDRFWLQDHWVLKLLKTWQKTFTKFRFWYLVGFECLQVNCGKTLSNINEQLLNKDEQNKGNGGEKYVNFPSEKS